MNNMRPNFKKLAKAYEQTGLQALRALIGKKSVYDATTISAGAPYGEGVKSALDYVAKLGKDYGLRWIPAMDTAPKSPSVIKGP